MVVVNVLVKLTKENIVEEVAKIASTSNISINVFSIEWHTDFF